MGLTKPDAPSDAQYLVTEEHALLTAEELIEGDYSTWTLDADFPVEVAADLGINDNFMASDQDLFEVDNNGRMHCEDETDEEFTIVDTDGTVLFQQSSPDIRTKARTVAIIGQSQFYSVLHKYRLLIEDEVGGDRSVLVVIKDGSVLWTRDAQDDGLKNNILNAVMSPNGRWIALRGIGPSFFNELFLYEGS